ncbi:MAG: hypothetical protein AAFV53_40855 [Myxococcota bacterium]
MTSQETTPAAPPTTTQPRFADTRELLAYGVKLGAGKAVQAKAIRQLQQRFPQHAEMLDNPAFLAGLKMALPLLGVQLAQQLRNPAVSRKVLDASQGMLLVNTIDTTADVAGVLADQLVELGSFLLSLYGVGEDDAQDAVRQLAQDMGADMGVNLTEVAASRSGHR